MPVDVPARLKCLNPLSTTGPSVQARVIEISRSGMTVRVNRRLERGAVVQIIVKNTFYMASVRYSREVEDGFEIGVRLTESIPSSLL